MKAELSNRITRKIMLFSLVLSTSLIILASPVFVTASQILDGQEAMEWLVRNEYIDGKTHIPLNNLYVFRSQVLGSGSPGPGGLKAISAEGWSFRGKMNQPIRNPVIVIQSDSKDKRRNIPYDISGSWNSSYSPNGKMARYTIAQNPGSNSFNWVIIHPNIPRESITNGIISGNQISARYNRPVGPDSNGNAWTPVRGRITQRRGNQAVEITWENGTRWWR